MKKRLLVGIGTVVILTLSFGGLFYFKKNTTTPKIAPCPEDVMMCPDGTSVSRSGPNCEFGVCKQDLPSYIEQSTIPPEATTTETTKTSPGIFSKIKTAIASITNPKAGETEEVVMKTKVETPLQEHRVFPQNQQQRPLFNETRYNIEGNKLIDDRGNELYRFPNLPANGESIESHLVNAIEVNEVPPIVNGIPVDGQSGKYYLSENSFGDIGTCQFSNKIYILDTTKNTQTLFYEENSSTLSPDDPRACSSEIYLLATDHEKLILKYHTIGTNSTCDSTWSEPEKTWYLDVTKNTEGTKHYYISPQFYNQAESLEANCRAQLEATTP